MPPHALLQGVQGPAGGSARIHKLDDDLARAGVGGIAGRHPLQRVAHFYIHAGQVLTDAATLSTLPKIGAPIRSGGCPEGSALRCVGLQEPIERHRPTRSIPPCQNKSRRRHRSGAAHRRHVGLDPRALATHSSIDYSALTVPGSASPRRDHKSVCFFQRRRNCALRAIRSRGTPGCVGSLGIPGLFREACSMIAPMLTGGE